MGETLNFWILNHYAGNDELGMEYRHNNLARRLRADGHRVSLVAASFHHLQTRRPPVRGPILFKEYDGIPFAFIRTPKYRGNGVLRLSNMLAYSLGVARHRRELERELGRPDVVLASSPHPFVVLNLLSLGARYGATTIFEVRDLWPQLLVELGSLSPWHPLTKLFGWLERRGYREADRVVSLWYSADRYMTAHGLTPERFLYLPNGIDLVRETEESPGTTGSGPLVRRVRDLTARGHFVVGYAGSHGFANPLDVILETAQLLQDRGVEEVDLFLVGDGPRKEQLVEAAKARRLDNLHFHDYVSKAEVMDFYREVDVCYMGLRDLPLFRYGPTPNKLMDYFAAAKPVLFSISSDYDPVAEAGAGCSVAPDDPEELARAILWLRGLEDNELREMGARGREYAERELDFGVLADRLIAAVRAARAET